jgi:hypothetical protein
VGAVARSASANFASQIKKFCGFDTDRDYRAVGGSSIQAHSRTSYHPSRVQVCAPDPICHDLAISGRASTETISPPKGQMWKTVDKPVESVDKGHLGQYFFNKNADTS